MLETTKYIKDKSQNISATWGIFKLIDLNDLWCKNEHFPHIDLEILRSPS